MITVDKVLKSGNEIKMLEEDKGVYKIVKFFNQRGGICSTDEFIKLLEEEQIIKIKVPETLKSIYIVEVYGGWLYTVDDFREEHIGLVFPSLKELFEVLVSDAMMISKIN